MSSYTEIDRYLDQNLEASIGELKKLCAIPSVAAQNLNMDECAELVRDLLKARGFAVEIMPSGGAPVVYAEREGKADKTLLFYNHYDVQPPEPLELWESPPFEATQRDGKLFARGVSDDKGQFVNRLYALDALLAAEGELPCNVKFVVEGEEEIGSVHLPEFVKNHAQKLAGDACIWEFGGVDHHDIPWQMLGLRGICYVELSVTTAIIDAHSGLGGSIFPNAAWRLVWALSTLKGRDERILIPGHYDNVVPPTTRDRAMLASLPDMAPDYLQRYGISGFLGGVAGGAELWEQEVFLPTCTICGLTSGYQGPGSKTVQPAKASAKVDFRLVPDQAPDEVLDKLRAHLDAQGFADVEITYLGGEPPGRTDPDDPFVKIVVESAEEVYGAPQYVIPMGGGSGPNHAFLHYLNMPVALLGIAHPGSQVHAPNENIRLDLYVKGAKHTARVVEEFSRSP